LEQLQPDWQARVNARINQGTSPWDAVNEVNRIF